MNKYAVEFLGAFFLVYIILATGNWMAIGAALAIAALLGGPISGGAFNPAVAAVLFVSGKIPVSDLLPYIMAEFAGALAAFQLFKMVTNK